MANKEEPLRILCIDGGGSRGVVAAEILQRLESQCCVSDTKLDKAFNLIVGTSVGAIIGAAVALKQATPTECKTMAMTLAPAVFGIKNSFGSFISGGPRYNNENLVKELKEFFDSPVNSEASATFAAVSATANVADNTYDKRVFVFNYKPRNDQPVILPGNDHYILAENEKLVEALLASAAAPTYLESQRQDVRNEELVDGGIIYNNPSLVALELASTLYPGREIACLVSVGTGSAYFPDEGRMLGFLQKNRHIKVLSGMANTMTSPEKVDEYIYNNRDTFKLKEKYFRFSPPLREVKLNVTKSRKLEDLVTNATAYMRQHHQRSDMTTIQAIFTAALAHPNAAGERTLKCQVYAKKACEIIQRTWNPMLSDLGNDECYDKLTLSNVFTKLDIRFREKCISAPYDFIVQKCNSTPVVFMITGASGMGKSTFVHKLFADWADKTNTNASVLDLQRAFDVVLLMNHECIARGKSLLQFCEETIGLLNLKVEEINNPKTLLVFDGLDEFLSGQIHSSIIESIERLKYCYCNIMFTSKTGWVRDGGTGHRLNFDFKLTCHGFTTDALRDYVQKMTEAMSNEFPQQITQADILKTPLFATIFCIAGSNQGMDFKSAWAKLHVIQLFVRAVAEKKNCTDHIKAIQMAIGKYFLKHTVEGDVLAKLYKMVGINLDIDENDEKWFQFAHTQLPFVLKFHDRTTPETRECYRCVHQMFTEYFVAYFLVEYGKSNFLVIALRLAEWFGQPDVNLRPFFQAHAQWQLSQNLVYFVMAFLLESNINLNDNAVEMINQHSGRLGDFLNPVLDLLSVSRLRRKEQTVIKFWAESDRTYYIFCHPLLCNDFDKVDASFNHENEKLTDGTWFFTDYTFDSVTELSRPLSQSHSVSFLNCTFKSDWYSEQQQQQQQQQGRIKKADFYNCELDISIIDFISTIEHLLLCRCGLPKPDVLIARMSDPTSNFATLTRLRLRQQLTTDELAGIIEQQTAWHTSLFELQEDIAAGEKTERFASSLRLLKHLGWLELLGAVKDLDETMHSYLNEYSNTHLIKVQLSISSAHEKPTADITKTIEVLENAKKLEEFLVMDFASVNLMDDKSNWEACLNTASIKAFTERQLCNKFPNLRKTRGGGLCVTYDIELD